MEILTSNIVKATKTWKEYCEKSYSDDEQEHRQLGNFANYHFVQYSKSENEAFELLPPPGHFHMKSSSQTLMGINFISTSLSTIFVNLTRKPKRFFSKRPATYFPAP